jgi:hypothetical protein
MIDVYLRAMKLHSSFVRYWKLFSLSPASTRAAAAAAAAEKTFCIQTKEFFVREKSLSFII